MQNIWGTSTQTHGGVIPENVRVESNGDVTVAVNGDYYAGDKRGVNIDDKDQRIGDGKSTGGVLISREAYGPGSFEAVMKIPSVNGVCTSLWLYNNWESGGIYNNHEIDIELHGTVAAENSEHGVGTYKKALFTSWLTETVFESEYKDVGYALNDGRFHKYRIDWHTGANPRVEYYIDDILLCVQSTYIPDNEMYVQIGCWFPNDWCGNPDFETDTMVIRSFGYTPFDGETAGTANTGGYTVTENRYCLLSASGSGFTSNIIANGSFDARADYMWTFTGDPPVKTDGSVTFTGSMAQTVELDCGGLELELRLTGAGRATVTVTYGSIVDGVEITGSDAFDYNGGSDTFDFAPPNGCTAFTVTVSAIGQTTLDSATLAVLGPAE